MGRQIIDWADLHDLAGAAPVLLNVSHDRLARFPKYDYTYTPRLGNFCWGTVRNGDSDDQNHANRGR